MQFGFPVEDSPAGEPTPQRKLHSRAHFHAGLTKKYRRLPSGWEIAASRLWNSQMPGTFQTLDRTEVPNGESFTHTSFKPEHIYLSLLISSFCFLHVNFTV